MALLTEIDKILTNITQSSKSCYYDLNTAQCQLENLILKHKEELEKDNSEHDALITSIEEPETCLNDLEKKISAVQKLLASLKIKCPASLHRVSQLRQKPGRQTDSGIGSELLTESRASQHDERKSSGRDSPVFAQEENEGGAERSSSVPGEPEGASVVINTPSPTLPVQESQTDSQRDSGLPDDPATPRSSQTMKAIGENEGATPPVRESQFIRDVVADGESCGILEATGSRAQVRHREEREIKRQGLEGREGERRETRHETPEDERRETEGREGDRHDENGAGQEQGRAMESRDLEGRVERGRESRDESAEGRREVEGREGDRDEDNGDQRRGTESREIEIGEVDKGQVPDDSEA